MLLAPIGALVPLLGPAQLDLVPDEDLGVSQVAAIPIVSERTHYVEDSGARGVLHVTGGFATTEEGPDRRAYLVAHDDTGSELWAWLDGTPGSRVDSVILPLGAEGLFASVAYTSSTTLTGNHREGRVLAFSDAGEITWAVDVAEDVHGLYPVLLCAPADGSRLFAAANDEVPETGYTWSQGVITSLDPGSGSVRWQSTLPDTTHAQHVCCDDQGEVVMVLADSSVGWMFPRLLAFDGETGAELWSLGFAAGGPGSVASMACDAPGRYVYVQGVNFVGGTSLVSLFAVDARTGSLVWDQELPGSATQFSSSDPDLLFVDAARGRLLVLFYSPTPDAFVALASLDLESGDVEWQTRVTEPGFKPNPLQASYDESMARLYVAYDGPGLVSSFQPHSSELSVLDGETGTLMEQYSFPLDADTSYVKLGALSRSGTPEETRLGLARTAYTASIAAPQELVSIVFPKGSVGPVVKTQLYSETPRPWELEGEAEGRPCSRW